MQPLRGVLAGAGFFAQFHADGWARVPGVQIAAVADPDTKRAAEFAARWYIPKIYASVEEALEAERPDFLDIVTRPDSHLALTQAAADRGVQVISQKPMAPTLEESVRMVEICERAGVRLLMHENWRWQPWYREIKNLDEQCAFGRVFHLGFLMRLGDGRGPNPYTIQPYFREMPRFLLYETSVHFLDTLIFLGGEIETLFCQTARLSPLVRGEDYALMQAGFKSGARGIIDANRISGPLPTESITFCDFRIEGDRAMARVAHDGSIWFTEYGTGERRLPFEPPRCGYKGDSVSALQQHLADCLRSGQPAESEGRAYLRTVEAVFACYESAETEKAVRLG
jgi:predicted dehydrogenase